MTDKEIRVVGWVCLLFSWGFLLVGAPWFGLLFGTAALCLFVWEILRTLDDDGGGPLSPA